MPEERRGYLRVAGEQRRRRLEKKTMIKVAPHIRSVVSQDGAVILDMPANRMTTLNSTGAYIWARLQEGKAIDSIVAELARDTGQNSAIVEHDVQEFLEKLTEKHLLND
jgi:hypothetical protein